MKSVPHGDPSPRAAPPGELSTRVRLAVGGLEVTARLTVPSGLAPPGAVLPALHGLVDTVVEAAEGQSARAGKPISCRKGCGACCRQLVPVSGPEAWRLVDLVASLPKARRRELRRRFADAARRLGAAGLGATLADPVLRAAAPQRELSLAYFALGIACPFLEDEACSIHPDRPLACREYLVTSPAALCARPGQPGVEVVQVPKLSVAARALGAPPGEAARHWLPLALALDWAKGRGRGAERRTGPEWVKRFFDGLGKR